MWSTSKPNTCDIPICGAKFYKNNDRKVHIRKVYNSNRKREHCKDCNKYFLKTGDHPCPKCNKICKNKNISNKKRKQFKRKYDKPL